MNRKVRKLITRFRLMSNLYKSFSFIPHIQLSAGKFFYQGLTCFLLLGIVSCSDGEPSKLNLPTLKISENVTKIKEVKPVEGKETTVYIQGKVKQQAPFINQQAYQIADATGKIWVVTKQNNLKVGQNVVIKGKVKYKSILLGEQEYGDVYLVEE